MQAIPLFDLPPAQGCYLGPETRVLCGDLIWRTVGDLSIGDELVAFEGLTSPGRRRRMQIATVSSWVHVTYPCFRVTFADGRQIVTSSECQWLTDPSGWWIYTRNLILGRPIRDLGIPWQVEDSWEAGWLGGAFDGEGWTMGGWGIGFCQNPGAVLDLAEHLCKKRGYEVRRKADKGRKTKRLFITGIYDTLRFLGECRPVRLLGKSHGWIETRTPVRSRGTARARRYSIAVESIEDLGDCDAVAIQTSTETILAEGLFGSLSYAMVKPSHH